MKIQISSLRTVNCGPLDDVCIDFTDEAGQPQSVIVLAGANGSGKTTILELIFALCELVMSDWTSARVRDKEFRGHRILSRTTYAQLTLLIDGAERFTIYYGDPVSGEPAPDAHPGSHYLWRHKDVRTNKYGPSADLIGRIHLAFLQQRDQVLSVLNNDGSANNINPLKAGGDLVPSILYFPVGRYLTHTKGSQIQREDTVYHWTYCYEPAQRFSGSLDSYLIWLDYAEPERFQRAIDFMADLNIDGKRFGVERKQLRATVTTRDGKTHGLEDLSAGEQHILILLLELYRRLLPGSIVLIDEIENSLHPALQYRLAQLLKRMQQYMPFQLIVTTHAPAFVESFGTQAVRILTETSGHS
jgi:predicted ATPase